ncbi:hypothetical protein ES319_D13G235900v1 [Gossypium barbadense]|uniref:Uncharacterized protein n=1 Tax=Gossypium barbadense TaxID=3634 RepID=A0A5J5NQ44_GOSBA|nr:hypothetical protein ES319_D13G235900v1 [Gossypium barbadense]
MKTHPFSHFFLSLFVLLDFAAMAAYEALGFSLSFPFLQKKSAQSWQFVIVGRTSHIG